MKTLKPTLTKTFGIFMIFGGILHFVMPDFYNAFIPDALPKLAINILGGLIELTLGIGLFIAKYKQKAALGILVLMLLFLPLHVWDVFRESPAIGSHAAALLRLPLQFVLIGWAWFISRNDAF